MKHLKNLTLTLLIVSMVLLMLPLQVFAADKST